MTVYALGFHGKFVRVADGRFEQVDLKQSLQCPPLGVDIACPTEEERFEACMTGFKSEYKHKALKTVSGEDYEVIIHPDGKFMSFKVAGKYLTSTPGGKELSNDRTEIGFWEKFLILDERDFSRLKKILAGNWCTASASGIITSSWMSFGEEYSINIGVATYKLEQNINFSCVEDAANNVILKFTFLYNGWKPDTFYFYNPLVFITAFHSEEYIKQAGICIESLRRFGGYRGVIHVLTDQEEMLRSTIDIDSGQGLVSFQSIQPDDWVGYVASKYCIMSFKDISAHQPLLFLDPDVVTDNEIETMLKEIAMSARIMAPVESFSKLSSSLSVGASLIQKSGYDPRFLCGFNAGTLGIPNVYEHGVTLRTIARSIMNYTNSEGRNSLKWVDQEFANFVAFSHPFGFDTFTLSKFVRFGWPNCEYDGSRRLGLVHFFWPRDGQPKSETMRVYVDTLVKGQHRWTAMQSREF